MFAGILEQVREERALSLALGDFVAPDQLERIIATAVAASHQHRALPLVVVVAYADFTRAASASPETITRIAARCGATEVLLDTQVKDGRGLLSWMDLPALQRWVAGGKDAGLLTAVAGGLQLAHIDAVRAANPDVGGVRGAACDGQEWPSQRQPSSGFTRTARVHFGIRSGGRTS